MHNRFRILLFLTCAIFQSIADCHASAKLVVNYHSGTASHREFIDALSRELAPSASTTFDIIYQDVLKSGNQPFTPSVNDLVVAVGTQMCERFMQSDVPHNVLCTLLPRQTYEVFRHTYQNTAEAKNIGAIFIDQPTERQIQFSHLLLPHAMQLGVINSEHTQADSATLTLLAKELNISIRISTIKDAESDNAELRKLFANSQAVLLPPDPVTYSPIEAKRLLYAAYNSRIPVIAFSKAYVQAGALGAVYSTPALIGKQTGEFLNNITSDAHIPPMRNFFSRYFEISINKSLARSLRLRTTTEQDILTKLLSANSTNFFAGQ